MDRLYLSVMFCTCLLIASCAIPNRDFSWDRTKFIFAPLTTRIFTLYTEQKITQPGRPLVIYIEGDGYSRVSRWRLSSDPTPKDLLVRGWAARDPRPNVVYLARPCQFIGTFQPPCQADYWDTKRLSPDIINSLSEAIDQLKYTARASHIDLIGYSGGGAAAALIAARRSDVASLITVAGNLDIALSSRLQGVSPLEGSLNPRDTAYKLEKVKQIHYVGGRDSIIPYAVTHSFLLALPPATNVQIHILPTATHNKGWTQIRFDNN